MLAIIYFVFFFICRACENLDPSSHRKQQSFIDHSLCCKVRSACNKIDTSECKSRKRNLSIVKTDIVQTLIPKRKSAPKTTVGFKMDTEEEHEVVCTPDIFSCLEDDPDDPVNTEMESEPMSHMNGSEEPAIKKPRISVRPPESLMQSPDQPMFPAIAQNRLLLCPMPGPSVGINDNPMPMKGNVLHAGQTNLVIPNTGAMYNANLRYNLVPVQRRSAVNPPPLSPLILNPAMNAANNTVPTPVKQTPIGNAMSVTQVKNLPAQNNRNSKYMQVNKNITKTYVRSAANATDNNAKNKPNDQTLSSLLQKKLKENPSINAMKLRKLPEWFHANTQSCLVIAYNFVSQLLDLQTKAQKVQNCSYDEVKNMHVQLSFFISALIGKLKSNQSELNTHLSEWTDTLCKSLEGQSSEGTNLQSASSIIKADPPRKKLSAAEIGQQNREEFKDIFKKFETDRKLNMDSIVSVAKFKFHKSTNVFKVKPKVRQIIKTPNIDPNVIQTIDSDSDDDDCKIISDPQPTTINSVGDKPSTESRKSELICVENELPKNENSQQNAAVQDNEMSKPPSENPAIENTNDTIQADKISSEDNVTQLSEIEPESQKSTNEETTCNILVNAISNVKEQTLKEQERVSEIPEDIANEQIELHNSENLEHAGDNSIISDTTEQSNNAVITHDDNTNIDMQDDTSNVNSVTSDVGIISEVTSDNEVGNQVQTIDKDDSTNKKEKNDDQGIINVNTGDDYNNIEAYPSNDTEPETVLSEINNHNKDIVQMETNIRSNMGAVDSHLNNKILGVHENSMTLEINESILNNRTTGLETDTIIGNKHSNIADATEQALKKLECVIGLEEMNQNIESINVEEKIGNNAKSTIADGSDINSFLSCERNISNAE